MNIIAKIKAFFKKDRIIYSKKMMPGKKQFTFRSHNGKRYVRIAFTNKVKYPGYLPMTDIPEEDITGVRVLPSRFKKFMYSLMGKRPKAIFYHFTEKDKHGTEHENNSRKLAAR